MAELNDQGKALLRLLITYLPGIIPGRPQTYPTYLELHRALKLQKLPNDTYGDSLKHQGLANMADWTKEAGFPAISGAIVKEKEREPGHGFLELFDMKEMNYQWWEGQIAQAKDFDWAPYVVTASDTPMASDIDEPPGRVKSVTYRILRNTQMSSQVKALHRHECQICGETIELSDGRRYAEAHHIRPLGSGHDGPDAASNIICVCPNHHVQLDYGAIPLVKAKLRLSPRHDVAEDAIEYHNRIYGFSV
jgi:hypothetical protein